MAGIAWRATRIRRAGKMARFELSLEIKQRWPDLLVMTVTAYGTSSEGGFGA